MYAAAGGVTQASDWSVGLDFGTAFSKAAATRIMGSESATLRQVRPLRIGEAAGCSRPYLVPSSMFLDRQRVHFGAWAVKRLIAADIEERELVRSFKKVLGANDFEGALNLYPRATVDPDRLFRLRDLIVLYLAYLLALVDAAVANSFGRNGAGSAPRLRFTRPGWIPDRIAAAHEAMTALFNEAHRVHQVLGTALVAPDGLDYAVARRALDAAQDNGTAFASLDGGIYEASAVGLCHYSDPKTPNFLLIVDVGAGTTDVAALVRTPIEQEICIVRAGRRTIEVAGDQFDAALVDLLVARSKLKTEADRSALWHRIVPVVRDIKEDLFTTGAVTVSFRGQKISCTARDLERRPAFKAAVTEIKTLYETCLAELVQVARSEGVRSIGVVLAGGGARLPALREAIMRRRWMAPGMRVKHLPDTPAWMRELGSGQEFEPLFSQFGAAFGAAISRPERPPADEAPEKARALRAEI
jgi:molecular chaperone DnaK (HSP70)